MIDVHALESYALTCVLADFFCEEVSISDYADICEYAEGNANAGANDLEVSVWEPFEDEPLSRLLEMIDDAYTSKHREFKHVLHLAHIGLIQTAIDDKLSLDMHEVCLETMFEVGHHKQRKENE